jgi:hypothetical protein
MDVLIQFGLDYMKRTLYPLTFKHIIYIALITIISTYILDYILGFRLLKWIYVGTLIVITATLYNQGKTENAAEDAILLARI